MKALKLYIIFVVLGIILGSCENFDEMNTDPNRMGQSYTWGNAQSDPL